MIHHSHHGQRISGVTAVPTLGMLWALCVTETPGAGPLLMAGGCFFLGGNGVLFCQK